MRSGPCIVVIQHRDALDSVAARFTMVQSCHGCQPKNERCSVETESTGISRPRARALGERLAALIEPGGRDYTPASGVGSWRESS
jgi:hypothetical protein